MLQIVKILLLLYKILCELSLLTSVWIIERVYISTLIVNIMTLAFLRTISLISIFNLRTLSCLFLGRIICQLDKWIVLSWSLIISLQSIFYTSMCLIHAAPCVGLLVLLIIISLIDILQRLTHHSSYNSLILLFYVVDIYITL